MTREPKQSARGRGHAKDQSEAGNTALVVVDMVNSYRHSDADALAPNVERAVPGIRDLVTRATAADAPLVYVNDNYGDWNSSAEELTRKALDGDHPELVEPILPPGRHSFVIKARHSIFYGTPLEYLLDEMGVDRLLLCGQVTEQCIFYSALDAHVRRFRIAVPADGVAAIHAHLAEAALEMMELNLSAEVGDGRAWAF